MAEQFDVEVMAVIAEGLANEAGRGDAFRAEPNNGEWAETRLEFTLSAHRVLTHARAAGVEMIRRGRR